MVVITARDDEAEIIRVLDAGADDYVVKPFGGGQIDARIRAVLRRTASTATPQRSAGRSAGSGWTSTRTWRPWTASPST